MKAYISGGAKNGKSTLAQNMALEIATKEKLPLYYVATMIPTDTEDHERIARHREERAGLGFITVERSGKLSGIVFPKGGCNPKGVFLIDSVTALLSNVMFPTQTVDMEHPRPVAWFNPGAAEEVASDLAEFLSKIEHAVLVSDYIYADPVPKSDGEDYTGTYMKGLAYIDREIAKLCDKLVEVSVGLEELHITAASDTK